MDRSVHIGLCIDLQCPPSFFVLRLIIRYRYPSFIDALRDLDDCLCHVFLFASLPVADKIESKHIEESRRLAAEFQNYVAASNCLKKTFLSIKGIYYQAEIRGQTITWLVPYQFSQEVRRIPGQCIDAYSSLLIDRFLSMSTSAS